MTSRSRASRVASLVVGLAVAAPAVASPAGINLFWNDCSIGPTAATNRTFACDTNAGAHVMVASFDPPAGITRLVGSSAVIDLRSTAQELPSWWQLYGGGCRDGAMSVLFTPTTPPTCFDYWSGGAMGGITFAAPFGGDPQRMRIMASFGIPEPLAGAVEPGNEYYAFRLMFDTRTTIGTEACGDCLAPMCIELKAIWLYQPEGDISYSVCNPSSSNFVTWQSALNCPGFPHPPPPPEECAATPTVRRTWGLIKGLYR